MNDVPLLCIKGAVDIALAESVCLPSHPCAQYVDWLNVSNKLRAMPLARKQIVFCFPFHDLLILVCIV